jgi:hypothetical protein
MRQFINRMLMTVRIFLDPLFGSFIAKHIFTLLQAFRARPQSLPASAQSFQTRLQTFKARPQPFQAGS